VVAVCIRKIMVSVENITSTGILALFLESLLTIEEGRKEKTLPDSTVRGQVC
jgi:hypothetical protein